LLFILPLIVIIYFASLYYNKKKSVVFPNFDAMQRINANIRKLVAYNSFKKNIFHDRSPTLVDILNMDPSDFPQGNKRNWINEIQKISNVFTLVPKLITMLFLK
jgi:hypothetical protein